MDLFILNIPSHTGILVTGLSYQGCSQVSVNKPQ